jgi:hypothetical protein
VKRLHDEWESHGRTLRENNQRPVPILFRVDHDGRIRFEEETMRDISISLDWWAVIVAFVITTLVIAGVFPYVGF